MVFEIHHSIGNRKAIILTTKCNNHCIYCHSNTNYEPFFDFSMIERRVKQEIKEEPVEIQITGGEPTIVPEFFEFLSFLKINYPNSKIKLITNLRMLSIEKFAEKTLNFVDTILTNFNSSVKKEYEAMTRTPKSYDQAIEALCNIKQLKERLNKQISLNINILITKINYKSLKNTVFFLTKEITIDNISIGLDYPYFINNAEKNINELYINIREAKQYIQEALIESKDVFAYNIQPCILDEKFRTRVVKQGFIHDERYTFPLKECNKCIYKEKTCNGIYKKNLELLKNKTDFQPVKLESNKD